MRDDSERTDSTQKVAELLDFGWLVCYKGLSVSTAVRLRV
jgi:hypothetical protein